MADLRERKHSHFESPRLCFFQLLSCVLRFSPDGRRIINYIQWQSRDLLQSAHKSPEFRREWGHFDQLTDEIDPHLYEVVQVMDGST